MRSVNNYSRYSNWSSPAVVNLSDVTVIVTTLPVPPQPQEAFPSYAYAVIAVAALLLLAVLIVATFLCISSVRKHYFVDMVRLRLKIAALTIYFKWPRHVYLPKKIGSCTRMHDTCIRMVHII